MSVRVEHPLGGVIAGWDSDGYQAFVWPSDDYPDDKRGWWWQLTWDGGGYLATEDELIHTPEWDATDEQALKVLATLASFLSAWQEASAWETRYSRSSENGDLFPKACLPFEPAIDEFALWGYEHENPEEES